MEIQAIGLTEIFNRLDDGHTLVTVNKRLSRELQQKYNEYKSNAGFNAWETPSIIPFDAWIHQLWQPLSLHEDNTISGVVLNSLQSKAIWKSIIEKDIARNNPDTQPLWSIEATTRAVMHAWHLLHTWRIDLNACAQSPVADHGRFVTWANQYGKVCKEKGWIDPGTLASVVTEKISNAVNLELSELTGGLIFTGFDHFTNQQNNLISTLRDKKICIQQGNITEAPPATQHNLKFDSEYQQWLGAAYWVREKIEQNKASCHKALRLAIIAPDLRHSRRMIEHALSQILCPGSLTTDDNRNQIFHFSLGQPLIEFPVIRSAMELLSLASGTKKDTLAIQQFLLGPYISGAEKERQERGKLEIILRKALPFQVDINQLESEIHDDEQTQKHLNSDVPILRKSLSNIIELQASSPKRMDFSAWTEHFLKCLDCFGWPGPASLNSREFQAIEAFKAELKTIGSLDVVSPPCGYRHALKYLHARITEKLFEGESSNPIIEVLDMPESAGLDFDAIWFGGVIENHWPPLPNASPFIPGYLQKESGYFRASTEQVLAHARIQQDRLAYQAGELIFSYHSHDKEVPVKPSPLITGPIEIGASSHSLFMQIGKKPVEFERYHDNYGLAYTNDDQTGEKSSGGTQLIENQSACAFRAYAIHRLGNRYVDARDQGLDALDRGQLIHRILEQVWGQIETSDKLKAMAPEDLENIITGVTKNNNNKFIRSSGCDLGFFDVHTQWLRQLLLEWFELEKIETWISESMLRKCLSNWK